MFTTSSLTRKLTSTLKRKSSVVLEGDAFELMSKIKDNSAAAWIFDPPFPKVEEHRATGTTTRLKISKSSHNPWFDAAKFAYEKLPALLRHADRTLVAGGHFLMKCDFDLLQEVLKLYPAAGGALPSVGSETSLVPQKLLLWDKQALGTGYVFRSRHEYWLWMVKGSKRRRVPNENMSLSDVFRYKRLKGKKYSPAQMPLAMAYDLVSQVTQVGDLVVDPFCGGGGTVPVVTSVLGRRIWACELDPSFAKLANERVARALSKKDDLRSELRGLSLAHQQGAVPEHSTIME
jgi:site-specific DNA-methyltransferase (adenine-specific)